MFDESGTYAEETLTPADPDSSCGTSGTPRWTRRPGDSDIARPTSCTPGSTSSAVADNPRLLELELVEPSLGWRQLDETTRDLAAAEFALGVESALERLGLGPLSHRRP